MKCYQELVNKRKSLPVDGYSEKHHIVPRSLGGSNNKSNIVRLTAREHFIAHMLLYKHYRKTEDKKSLYKMALAMQLLKSGRVHAMSKFRLSAGASKIYETAKVVISQKMVGDGNPMYGKPSANKGKTHKEMYSRESLLKVQQSNIRKRKYPDTYSWVHKDHGTEELTMYELADIYGFDHRKLIDVLDPTTPRKTSYGWGILGVDSRSKNLRSTATTKYSFYTLPGGQELNTTIDDMLDTYTELTYVGLRNLVNKGKSKSYKGWMLKATYDERLPLYTYHNTTRFWCNNTIIEELSICQLSEKYSLDVGKLVEVTKNKRTSVKGWKLKE